MLRRRIAGRIVALAVAAALSAIAIAVAVTRTAARELAAGRVAELVRAAHAARIAAACEGDGRVEGIGGVTVFVYDARGVPLSPSAPPIDRALLEALREDDTETRFDRRGASTRTLWRAEHGSRCAFAQADIAPRTSSLGTFASVLAVLVVVLGATAALAAWLVAGPLLARLDALRRSAATVGTSGYQRAPRWEDEAGEIARTLDEAHAELSARAEALAGRSEALERFLAETAHDVRTPLASLALALDEIAEDAPPACREPLSRALNDVVYLRSLTQNLRLATRLDGGWRPAAHAVDVSEIAERVVQRCHPFAIRRGMALERAIEPDAVAAGDEVATEQALVNLVENAILHAEAGTRIRVAVARVADRVRVTVEDDGPGLVPTHVPKLAEPRPARGRDAKGQGLGLAITAEICARSGWEIAFGTADPRGLRVTIDAPARARSAP